MMNQFPYFVDPFLCSLDAREKSKLMGRIKQWGLSTPEFYNTLDRWFSNFETKDKRLALKVIHNLQYRNAIWREKWFESQLNRIRSIQIDLGSPTEQLFIATAPGRADSSDLYAYTLTKIWHIPREHVVSVDDLSSLDLSNAIVVLPNDTYGSGNQFAKEVWPKLANLPRPPKKYVILAVTIAHNAFKAIREICPDIYMIPDVHEAMTAYRLFSYDEGERLKELGKKVYPKHPLGFGDTALLVAYEYQCPNNTIPIVWADGENNRVGGQATPWSPLFTYRPKVRDEYKKMEKEYRFDYNKVKITEVPLSNIRKITVHGGVVEYSDIIGGIVGTIPVSVYQRNLIPPLNPVNDVGWYEILSIPAGGKTTLAYLMADLACRDNRQTLYFDFRLSDKTPKLPSDVSEKALLLLDNAHLSVESDIRQLFHKLPKDFLVVAFSREGTGLISQYLPGECKTIPLDDSEIQRYLSDAVSDIVNLSSEEYEIIEKCINEVSDWEQARGLIYALKSNIKKTIKEYSNKSSIDEYLFFLIRDRLKQDGLLENEVLVDIASFTFIDLPILPAERNRSDNRFEIEFLTLRRHGWLFRDGTQLSHPRFAEQILRTLGVLSRSDEGEILGRHLAKILTRSNATEARLQQVVRNIRYGGLPPLPRLLVDGLYAELLATHQQPVPLDPVYIHLGSDLRRQGEITRAMEHFNLVSESGRNALWRYEYAFVLFMEGTHKSLAEAEVILLPDLGSGNPKDRFINSGLYALVLSRQGRLEEADRILGKLIDLVSSVSADRDAKRWGGNAAIHYCETGEGLVAHGKLAMTELENRIATADSFLDEPALKGGRAYIESLYAALKGDWNSCWRATKILLDEASSMKYVQQRGVYLALMAAATPFLGEAEKERALLNEILALPSEFDNRRAQSWAQIRIREIGSPVDPRMLIRTLYPDVTSQME